MENQLDHASEIYSQSTGWKILINQKCKLKLFLINSQQYKLKLLNLMFFNGDSFHLSLNQLEILKLEMLMILKQIYGQLLSKLERKSWRMQFNGIALKSKERINLLLIQEMLLFICFTTESSKIHPSRTIKHFKRKSMKEWELIPLWKNYSHTTLKQWRMELLLFQLTLNATEIWLTTTMRTVEDSVITEWNILNWWLLNASQSRHSQLLLILPNIEFKKLVKIQLNELIINDLLLIFRIQYFKKTKYL